MLKKTFLAGLAVFGLAFTDSYAGLSTDDYIEAAWMTTRFFGAQRSGQGPNWVLDGTNNPTSFTGDKYNGKDVSGGWFDCGDHVMYGQTQGFASYILAVSFAEFTKGFYDLYTAITPTTRQARITPVKAASRTMCATFWKSSATKPISGPRPPLAKATL